MEKEAVAVLTYFWSESDWGEARTISFRAVCVAANIRTGPLQLKSVGKLPRWWNILNFIHALQMIFDITGRGMEDLVPSLRSVVFTLRTCTQKRSTETISKLCSTKSFAKRRFLYSYISVALYKNVFFSGGSIMAGISLCYIKAMLQFNKTFIAKRNFYQR